MITMAQHIILNNNTVLYFYIFELFTRHFIVIVH